MAEYNATSWGRFKWVVSAGSLDEPVLASNFMRWLQVRGAEFRVPYPAETLDDYVDYLFQVMEDNTPEGKYFGTPDDFKTDIFGFFPLPDKRRI